MNSTTEHGPLDLASPSTPMGGFVNYLSGSQHQASWTSSVSTTADMPLAASGDEFQPAYPVIQNPPLIWNILSISGPASFSIPLGPDVYYLETECQVLENSVRESQPRALYNQTVAEASGSQIFEEWQSSLNTTNFSLPLAVDIINAHRRLNCGSLAPNQEAPADRVTRPLAQYEDNLNVLNYENGNNEDTLIGSFAADRTVNFGPADPFVNCTFFALAPSRP